MKNAPYPVSLRSYESLRSKSYVVATYMCACFQRETESESKRSIHMKFSLLWLFILRYDKVT